MLWQVIHGVVGEMQILLQSGFAISPSAPCVTRANTFMFNKGCKISHWSDHRSASEQKEGTAFQFGSALLVFNALVEKIPKMYHRN